MAESSFLKNYDIAEPMLKKIFGNDQRIRIMLCLDDNARFFDDIVEFVEGKEFDVHQDLEALKDAGVVQCVDEIYSLTPRMGVPTVGFIKDFNEIERTYKR